MMIGINNPDRYAAIGCFSAAARHGNQSETHKASGLFSDSIQNQFDYILFGGEDTTNTLWDTYYMADKNKNRKNLPRIFHTIGKGDFLLEEARSTRDFFQNIPGNPYQYVYEEHEGVHGWDYWDAHITDFLDFLNLKQPVEKIAN